MDEYELAFERRRRKQASYRKRDEERQKRMAAVISNTNAEDAAGPSHPHHPTAAAAPRPPVVDSQPAARSAAQRAVDPSFFGGGHEKKVGRFNLGDHPKDGEDEMEGPIAFVGAVNKASPSSSVSMSQSQSPATWPTRTGSPSKKRSADEPKYAVPSSKKNIFGATKTDAPVRPLLLLGKRAGYGTDSSSDDDDDLFRVRFDRPPKAGAVPPAATATAIITLAKEPRSRSAPPPPPPDGTARVKTIWEELATSSDDSDYNGGGFLATKRRKTTTMLFVNNNDPPLQKDAPLPETAPEEDSNSPATNNPPLKKDAPLSETAPEEDPNSSTKNATKETTTTTDEAPATSPQSSPKVVRNPLTLERAQREETAAAMQRTASMTNNATGLWDDDDTDDGDNKDGLPNDKNGSMLVVEKEKVSPALEDSEEALREKWYPSFDKPKTGPVDPPEPLVLSEAYQVPASISRYLYHYQPEGIKFMFDKAIFNQRGCILGDGM
jgi:hypothetical protein